ncbi:nuclear transport factor 2 family protein [Ekhidna sp.]|uniref:YybH family protein n=1 Tax=Ekhidna sp. TaxID=2608089 RepID=UPI003511FF16
MKNITYLSAILILASCSTSSQGETAKTKPEQVIDLTAEENAIKKVMKTYKETLESLDVTESYALFSEESEVLEQGKIEGTYRDYIANHIGPELGHFESFTFSDYEISVIVDMPYAFTTESYIYNIVLKEEFRKVERKAAATSVLKKIDGSWKIIKTHSSSRAVR